MGKKDLFRDLIVECPWCEEGTSAVGFDGQPMEVCETCGEDIVVKIKSHAVVGKG